MNPESPAVKVESAKSDGAVQTRRIVWIDIARALAIVAMAVYHFTWDLEHFGYIPPHTVDFGFWKLFARADASSFLFLVGIGLVLAHRQRIKWKSFWRRFAMIATGAAAITAVTRFITPDTFIFFGILHAIALDSLIGLAFLRLPPLLTVAAAAGAFVAPWYLRYELFDKPPLWFVGLSETLPRSNDYVPLLPWAAPFLIGIAAARLALSSGGFAWLRAHPPRPGQITAGLVFAGRHSLAIYLLHQPLLFGLVFVASQIVPPAPPASEISGYLSNCQAQCTTNEDEAFCRRFCQCTVDALVTDHLFTPLGNGSITPADPRVSATARQCTRTDDDE